MSILTLHINQLAEDRGKSFVNPNFAKPAPSVSLIFSDIYDTTIQFVNNTNITSSLFTLEGTAAYLSLGNPGFPALCLATCSVVSPTAYSALFHLNTNNLDYDLAPDQTKQYVLELSVVSGSSVVTWQHPCTVKKDILLNEIYPLSAVQVISSSYAVSSSIANRSISSSYSDTSKQVSFGNPYGNFDPPMNSFMLVRGEGGCLISLGEQNLLNQITVAGISIYDETIPAPDDEIIRISPSTTWFSGSNNFGIGTSFPDGDPYNKLQVAGNISCSAITASKMLGTATFADTASLLKVRDNSGNVVIDTHPQPIITVQDAIAENRTLIFPGEISLFSPGLTAVFSLQDTCWIQCPFNFGIGTDAPAAKLQVQGNISGSSITGSIHATSQTAGTVALSGGMALVNTTDVNTNSKIFLTSQTGDGGYLWVGNRTNGVSFQITSSTSNTQSIAWFIIN